MKCIKKSKEGTVKTGTLNLRLIRHIKSVGSNRDNELPSCASSRAAIAPFPADGRNYGALLPTIVVPYRLVVVGRLDPRT